MAVTALVKHEASGEIGRQQSADSRILTTPLTRIARRLSLRVFITIERINYSVTLCGKANKMLQNEDYQHGGMENALSKK